MKYILSLAFAVCFFSAVSAQEVGVRVVVSADFGLGEQVTSKINKYFRQFKDVVLVEDDNCFVKLSIIIIEIKLQGDAIGYAVSAVVREPIGDLDGFLLKRRCPKGASAFDYYIGRDLVKDQWLYVVPAEKLDAQCQAIVEAVDTRHLEPLRKTRRAERK